MPKLVKPLLLSLCAVFGQVGAGYYKSDKLQQIVLQDLENKIAYEQRNGARVTVEQSNGLALLSYGVSAQLTIGNTVCEYEGRSYHAFGKPLLSTRSFGCAP